MCSVYLDHASHTPADARVIAAWVEAQAAFGANPSAPHARGARAARAVEAARAHVAGLVGADAGQIVFTSGATESNNLALFGFARRRPRGHIITARTEHHSVLEPLRELEGEGWRVSYLPVDAAGRLDVDELRAAIREDTRLVSLMWVNNELGTVHPIEAVGEALQGRDIAFHCDATQAVGRLRVDAGRARVDLLTFSGHKLYGPGGVGALFVRNAGMIAPRSLGGGHERGLRSGSLDAPLLVAFGRACELARTERERRLAHLSACDGRLRAGLAALLPQARILSPADAAPGILSVALPGIEAADLLLLEDGLAFSTGAVCPIGHGRRSHVLEATGLEAQLAASVLRLSPGDATTLEGVEHALRRIRELVDSLRGEKEG